MQYKKSSSGEGCVCSQHVSWASSISCRQSLCFPEAAATHCSHPGDYAHLGTHSVHRDPPGAAENPFVEPVSVAHWGCSYAFFSSGILRLQLNFSFSLLEYFQMFLIRGQIWWILAKIQELRVMDIQWGINNHNNMLQLYSISVSKVLVREGVGRGKKTNVLSAKPNTSHFCR